MKKNLSYILGFSVSLIVGMVVIPWMLFQLEQAYPWTQPIIEFLIAIRSVVIFISTLVGGVSGLLLIILRNKERRALNVITQAGISDHNGDVEGLKRYCRLCFYKLHYAWCKNDHVSLAELVTKDFLAEIKSWDMPPAEFQNDLINTVEITDTNIISSVDRIDNTKDQYAVMLQGNYIYPLQAYDTSNGSVGKMAFNVICNFSRIDGHWKMCGVDDHVNLIKILSSSSMIERQNSC